MKTLLAEEINNSFNHYDCVCAVSYTHLDVYKRQGYVMCMRQQRNIA